MKFHPISLLLEVVAISEPSFEFDNSNGQPYGEVWERHHSGLGGMGPRKALFLRERDNMIDPLEILSLVHSWH